MTGERATGQREGGAGGAVTFAALLERAVERLGGSRAGARVDAEVLLAHVTGRPRHHATAWPEQPVGAPERARFEALVARRAAGEPVAYLTGWRGFWSFELEVTPATLIPRPETEHLVEIALALDLPGEQVRVLDLGTGSGAVAIAIALERPAWEVVASDASAPALGVARANAVRLGAGRIDFREGHWLEAARDERFSLVASNPPYVAAGDPHLERGDPRFEPASALRSGADGLDAIRIIVRDAPAHLAPGGWLALEHGHEQADAVAALLRARGFEAPESRRDHAGHLRACLARWTGDAR